MALADLVGRIFPPRGRCTIERTADGVSTQVYRVRCGGEIFYLRVAEERAASLGPEVHALEVLRARYVRVPDVVHFEPFDERLERSVMVTTEVPGEPLGHRPVDAATPEVLRAAGQDLAVINSVPVQGFGWITRDKPGVVGPLRAEHGSHRSFALDHLDEELGVLEQRALATAEINAIRSVIDGNDTWLDVARAWLAHGDFDVTHIYQRDGQYTGIIDFGEIRGADRLYDLGHFNLHDGERLPEPVLPALLAGYRDAAPVSADDESRINFWSVLIGVRALARNVRRQPPNAYQRHLLQAIRRSTALLNR